MLKKTESYFLNSGSRVSPFFSETGGNIATLNGSPTKRATPIQLTSRIVYASLAFGATPSNPRDKIRTQGIVTEHILIADLLIAVSITALSAQTFEIPIGFLSSKSSHT